MTTQTKASGKPYFTGTSLLSPLRATHVPLSRSTAVAVRAQNVSRREGVLGFVAGIGTLIGADVAQAAYGTGANIFGKTTDSSGFIPYIGEEGFALTIPSKWNPSLERDFPGVTVRYEDNGDTVTNFMVIVQKTEKKSISDFGNQDEFLKSTLAPLLGKQVFTGETQSEGGFKPGIVATASLLSKKDATDKNGKAYYQYEVLTRAADGDEGGRHHIFSASVSNGQLYILKAQCGDKRWFKGARKDVQGLVDSFTVA